MPVQVSYPGVYIQEIPSGVRTITGVSTSVAAFVGMVQRGKLNTPARVLSFPDYQRKFGTDTTASEMTDQVRQFFLNGGQEAWITRIANNAAAASVQLANEAGLPVMTVTACEAGPDGNLIQLEVDYDTAQPEETFNLRVFRPVTNIFGVVQIETDERFSGLSMDPSSGNYVESIVNQQSELIRIDVEDALTPSEGFSLSGLLFETDDTANTTLSSLLSSTANSIQISVDGSSLIPVVLPDSFAPADNPFSLVEDRINMALTPFSRKVSIGLVTNGLTSSRYLEIRSTNTDDTPKPGGSVSIQPAATNDATVALQLGAAQGGLEIAGYGVLRPAITGFFARLGASPVSVEALSTFADANALGMWTLSDASGFSPHTDSPTFAGTPFSQGTVYDVGANPGLGSLLNVRQNLQVLADSINANAQDADGQPVWSASLQGYRLVLRPLFGDKNADATATLVSDGAYDLGADTQFFDPTPSTANVLSYSLGTTGSGDFQSSGMDGTPGGIPSSQDYQEAFNVIDRVVDIFNLLILPRATLPIQQSDPQREALWGLASSFCLNRRAFLLVDPRSTWETVNDVESEITQLRNGVVKDHAAIYWPRVQIPNGSGSLRTIDPSGSIAGVMARIDSNRGVWKAPAGLEADLRGVRALEYSMSDPENGVINPEAVNAIRSFPTGIVSWGARTMDGSNDNANADYRYVPIRRIALFIEESLFRGLKFAVFEPNDEPLWAQIRLAAGAFMNNLFRQGAFQGQKARDAYFVKVDSETTTQNDINLGIVNVVIGFAPLRPAEFVVITLQQMAGQVQT